MIAKAIYLSPQQTTVLTQRTNGKCFKEIAFKMKLSPKTVEFHWGKCCEKIGTHDVALLTRWVIANLENQTRTEPHHVID